MTNPEAVIEGVVSYLAVWLGLVVFAWIIQKCRQAFGRPIIGEKGDLQE